MKQVCLKKNSTYQILWLDDVKEGDKVKLKNKDEWWDVIKVYHLVDKDKNEINRNWHVGGL